MTKAILKNRVARLPFSKHLRILVWVVVATANAVHAHAQLIIANPSVKVSGISKGEIKDVFTGDSSNVGGSHVMPVLLKSGRANDSFLSIYIGKSQAAFMASWRTLVFSGQATMPKSFDSEAAVVEFVVKTPGAIGYIGRDTPHEGVRVLADR